jgi:hypothetical protein
MQECEKRRQVTTHFLVAEFWSCGARALQHRFVVVVRLRKQLIDMTEGTIGVTIAVTIGVTIGVTILVLQIQTLFKSTFDTRTATSKIDLL